MTKVSVGGSLSCLSFVQAQLICHTLDIVLLMSNAVIMPPSALDRLGKLSSSFILRP